jgi:two-component system nitrate/nitrite response regulator NarL
MDGERPSRAALVVDDDAEARAVLASALARGGYLTLEATSGEEALEIVRRELPSVICLDICLSGICGYQVLHELRTAYGPGLPIVLVSGARGASCDRVAGLLLGADDFFTKPIAADEFLIRVRRLLDRSKPVASPIASKLTSREQEILGLLAQGLDPDDIAARLFITRKTVGTHSENIFRKLQVHNRAQAVALAYRQDLLRSPGSRS